MPRRQQLRQHAVDPLDRRAARGRGRARRAAGLGGWRRGPGRWRPPAARHRRAPRRCCLRRVRHPLEQLVDPIEDERPGRRLVGADEEVLLQRHRGEEPATFGHERYAPAQPLLGRAVREVHPSKRTAPDVGRCSPAIVRSRVDLPAPLAPTIASDLPGARAARDVVERAELPVVDDEVLHLQERAGAAPPPLTTSACDGSLTWPAPLRSRRVGAEVDLAHASGLASTARGSPSPITAPPPDADQALHSGDERPHHVLDPDHGHALGRGVLDDPGQLAHLEVGEPAGDLVEQQQLRTRGERPGEFQALACKRPSEPAELLASATEPGALKHATRGVSKLSRPCALGSLLGGDERVLEDRQVLEGLRNLVGPPDARGGTRAAASSRLRPAFEADLARVGA